MACCSCGGSLARHAPTARFVRQGLDPLRQKALHPCAHTAPAEPNRGRNGRDRDSISDEYDHPAASGQPRGDGRGPLPRPQRPAFRRCEGECSCASTRHTAPFCDTWVPDTMLSEKTIRGTVGACTYGEGYHSTGPPLTPGTPRSRGDLIEPPPLAVRPSQPASAPLCLPACDGRRCLAYAAVV